jgi:hypothetical protein
MTYNNIDHMCIKNHTHCSVESVSERRLQPLHCRQSVNRSTGCRSPRHCTRLPRSSTRNPLSRWPEDMLQRNLHCSTYNIEHKQGCLEPARPAKTSQQHAPWNSSSPPPFPQEKHPQPDQKCLPIQTSSSPIHWPRYRSPDQTPSTNQLHGPHRRFVTGSIMSDHVFVPSRTRILDS